LNHPFRETERKENEIGFYLEIFDAGFSRVFRTWNSWTDDFHWLDLKRFTKDCFKFTITKR
jgi:hypothetical protein